MIFKPDNELLREGLCLLLKIKDSDIRMLDLYQGDQAVDRGIHIGGAFSAVVPMVSLFYGGFIDLDVADPTRVGQDMFVLSKGHAVATMASIYVEFGYFDKSLLVGSRSVESILNGHPGPLLPGVHVATGPLGQGLSVAHGLAMAGKGEPEFNVFCVTGDGELQEGVVWEAFMHAPHKRLDNLCVLVDKNHGQLDNHAQLIFPMDNLAGQIESFGWRVFSADGTSYGAVTDALNSFATLPRDGRPTAIVCASRKGFGSFSEGLNKHKVTLSEEVYDQELVLQKERRSERVKSYLKFREKLAANGKGDLVSLLDERAETMSLKVDAGAGLVEQSMAPPRKGRVPERDKKITFTEAALPKYPRDAQVMALDVIKKCMSLFARDSRVVSVDSDLGSTSGLESGVASVDQHRGINVGIAESNMMCVGEAYAALGYNAWVSTFCPFFDWKVFRRIAVGAQERAESMEAPDGWLSRGHGLDLTFLATAANFDTVTNGATHMGNDDIIVYAGIAGLNIIDVSCPNQLVGVMRWIMEGNRGLNYVRIMRAASGVMYEGGFKFEYGKAYRPYGNEGAEVVIVSSGRGVHEAVSAAKLLEADGRTAAVYDMPSFDKGTMMKLLTGNSLVLVAEQNNGFIWHETGRMLLASGGSVSAQNCFAINANRQDGSYHYVHSATYKQLIRRFGLEPEQLASAALARLGGKKK